MPLNVYMKAGDRIEIDGDIVIEWVKIPGGGRTAKLLLSAKGHDVQLLEPGSTDNVLELGRRAKRDRQHA